MSTPAVQSRTIRCTLSSETHYGVNYMRRYLDTGSAARAYLTRPQAA